MVAWTFEAIGTAWQIDTPHPLSPGVQVDVLARIEEFDRTWSRFRDDSTVSDIARSPGVWAVPDSEGLLDFYDALHDVTDGAVNPLVARTLSDLGYDAQYSLRASEAPTAVPPWSALVRDGSTLTTVDPLLLDVGAAGKGLLVDLVAAALGDAGHCAGTIDASGDLYHLGPDQLRVALEHPGDATRAIGVVELEPEDALCGSATNRRTWGDGLHHVLDARTGRPTTDVIATWVLAPQSCMIADGLATAHFFADPDTLLERWDHQFVRMHADGRVVWSPDLQGEMFS